MNDEKMSNCLSADNPQCPCSVVGFRCNRLNGHAGFHVHAGLTPRTTFWWRMMAEDPVAQAIAQERERCAKVADEWCPEGSDCTKSFPCLACLVAKQIREGK